MSKVDAQRAMREAKYARTRASGPTRREEAAAAGKTAGATPPATATAPATTTPPAATPPPARKPARAATAAAAPQGETCGHKSMNGRSCTREAGHPEKSHRYG